jgi:NAD(P)-dependent dehydrogenase (short-subunit alcohol dehydrogenase family)
VDRGNGWAARALTLHLPDSNAIQRMDGGQANGVGSRSRVSITADLSGRRALITGASAGLGLHFAEVLHAAGAEVVLAARSKARLDEHCARLGARAAAVGLDVRSDASIAKAFAEAGPVDILINNAGVTVSKPVLDQTAADWDEVLDTNLKGAFLVATEGARAMRDAGRGGTIINIASILGLRQAGHVTGYAIAKAGLIQLTKQLALELARFDIRVNVIAPGYFETDINRDFFAGPAGQALIKRIPQRRLGQLADLDGPLLLLASDASAFMTGTVLVVDGGHLVASL